MKEKTAGLLFVGLFSSGACLLLLLGCLALKRNYDWLSPFFFICSMFCMLLLNSLILSNGIEKVLKEIIKQEETENPEKTWDSEQDKKEP